MLSRVGLVGGVAARRAGLRTVTTCVAARGGGGNSSAVAPPFYRLPDSKEPVRCVHYRVCAARAVKPLVAAPQSLTHAAASPAVARGARACVARWRRPGVCVGL